VLGGQLLCTVLADDGDARIRERLHVVDRDVLRRGHDRHAGADLSCDALVALADDAGIK
jgi:hypothetical protein